MTRSVGSMPGAAHAQRARSPSIRPCGKMPEHPSASCYERGDGVCADPWGAGTPERGALT
jgi:hypothetical protein